MNRSAYLYHLFLLFGQNTLFPRSIRMDGTRVSATSSAMPIDRPITRPMVRIIEKSAMANAKNDIITVAPLVDMLSPAHVTDVLTASSLTWPLMRSSRYLATMNMA